MSDDLKKEIRQVLMLISSIRSMDNERYEEHVNFTGEVIGFIKKIEEKMNQNWEQIHESLGDLNKNISDSLDSLLTGINPEGIKETSQSLKEIMNTMQKSIQSMNLENVMQELRGISGSGIKISAGKSGKSSKSATPIKAGLSTPYSSGGAAVNAPAGADDDDDDDDDAEYTEEELQMQEAAKEVYGYIPEHLKKSKKPKKETHLLKPSDFFGM
jgi:hypothetical protein